MAQQSVLNYLHFGAFALAGVNIHDYHLAI
jgi:hypothetical protein